MRFACSVLLRLTVLLVASVALGLCSLALSQASRGPDTSVSALVASLRAKSKSLESSPAERAAFESFVAGHKLSSGSVSLADFVLIRVIFEATRDAGFWNMHWSITDQLPNSDRIWRQWKSVARPSFTQQTAIAECDELSALFAFLAARAGIQNVGLFWPYPNHTVAVWTIRPAHTQSVRVVVPTSQIFLAEEDTFDTKKFDPWRQKTIYNYTRRDVSDSFALPKPLLDFFIAQLDKYGGASAETLQQIRNLRDAVFQNKLTPDAAAREALRRESAYSRFDADHAAFQSFATDIRSESPN